MMEHLLDEYTQCNALSDQDARLKLGLGIGAILIGTASTSLITPIFIAMTTALITVGIAKIPLRLYLALLTIPISFALPSGIVILLTSGGGAALVSLPFFGFTLSVTTGSANLALLLMARTFGGMCALYFIALTTTITEIFSIMHSLRLPPSLIDLSLLIYHFIFVLIGEAISIHTAQVLRHGYDTFRSKLQSLGMLAAMLFIRAWQQGEDLLTVMDARCYDGRLDLGGEYTRPGVLAVTSVLIYLSACIGIAYLTASVRIF
jgi:cobalt/nickel transport system permease protein